MPSNFLTPFVELDDEFSKNFHSLDVTGGTIYANQKQHTVGFQRSHSVCPGTLFNKINSSSTEMVNKTVCWPIHYRSQDWNQDQQQKLPRSSISHIPFRVDRSVSMIEGSHVRIGVGEHEQAVMQSLTPPDFNTSTNSLSSPKSPSPTSPLSTRYKTELCRTYEESGTCKYDTKCQFAHGIEELRGLNRHPKYKTEPCRTFHTIGFCPYGSRCHFIHNADEQLHQLRERLPILLNGFQSVQQHVTSSKASLLSFLSSPGTPELLSPAFSEYLELGTIKNNYPLSTELGSDQLASPCFNAITDLTGHTNYTLKTSGQNHSFNSFLLSERPLLQRTISADSLSDPDGYASSGSLSGSESPSLEGKRLPIFSRLSIL
ncbi:mRNA decay activator protein ZFP36L1 [Paramormyrops kingsleyae]|uniref:mRNA decay activator protein ZFP36 n=1 Tax=Paramormyrops kingsleyae TaxID=1676925 RepID=A0A3B3RQA6_9TELE|nr:mRNA decay activator protein ZFP36L1-like [Paramormyrops kingsleyae]